jgi:hypothetical protein
MLADALAAWSLVIGIIALVVSIVAIGVSVELWRRTGPQVKVRYGHSYPVFEGRPSPEHHLSVTAANTGRSATTVQGWGFQIDGTDATVVTLQPEMWQPRLPYRLEPHASVSWHMKVSELQQSLASTGRVGATIRAIVYLETGEKVLASTPVRNEDIE